MKRFRHLLKSKSYAVINLLGLTLGLSVSIVIFLYVQDELSYDQYLPGYEKVIRIQPSVSTSDGVQQWATSEGFLAPAIAAMYPQIEASTRILRSTDEIAFNIDSTQFSQGDVAAVDSTFFTVFPFEFIYGDRATALDKPSNMVITQSVARKFFGDIDPVGKSVVTHFGTFQITGVFADAPRNSHFHLSVMLPMRVWFSDADQSRNMYAFYSYLRLKSADEVESFSRETLRPWYTINEGKNDQSGIEITLEAMKLSDIHLQSRAEKELEANGQQQIVYIFTLVAILILIIAAINYINLSNAIAIKRAKEVAIRKTVGASRRNLFLNFIFESYSFSLLAFVLSLLLVGLLIPQFNIITGKAFDASELLKAEFLRNVLIAWIVLGFLSGFYPATILSSFNPLQALKSNSNSIKTSNVSLYMRRGLIIFQFAISVLMIVSAMTIQGQLNFIESRNIGFDKNNVVVIPLTGEAHERTEALKSEINKLGVVESSAITSVVPGKRVVILVVRVPDLAGSNSTAQGTDDGTREIRVMSVDHDFIKTLGLQIIDGRDFSNENAADAEEGFILNEAAVKEFNLKDPVGKPFEYTFRDSKKGKVIGVVKDFNFASVHTPVEPLMLHIYPNFYSAMCIRLKTTDVKTSIDEIESAWIKVSSAPFSYQFLDATYDAMYKSEKTTGQVITVFTTLSVIIAGLGLFGIVSFFAAQRTKEVGMRKIFGASQVSLLKVLSQEYIMMVAVGNIIAIFPTWMLVNQWLEQFAFHISLSSLTFFIAFIASIILALCSISYVLVGITKTNPIAIIKNE